jgi:hypothetical protein
VILARLPGAADQEPKLLVVLSHQQGHVITIKATTQVDLYLNNAEAMAGVVMYEPGETCFRERTAVQPDNWFAVNDRNIRAEERIGHLPDDFHRRLVTAIKGSVLLTGKQRAKLLTMIGEEI